MKNAAEVPFVGETRKEIVESLVERVRRLQQGDDVPRVVVFQAESGAGKSRIVREFYERLRKEQPGGSNGGYWPPLPTRLDVKGGHGERVPLRKWLGPDIANFQRAPGSLPVFSWWTLNCEKRESSASVAAAQEIVLQATAHGRFLSAAINQTLVPQDRLKRWADANWQDLGIQMGAEAGLEGLAHILNTFDVAVPGAGLGLAQIVRATKSWLSKRETTRLISSGGSLVDDALTAPVEIFTQLARLSLPRLPMILAVEDLHLMGPDLEALLTLIAQPASHLPMLVVATSWPAIDPASTYARWMSEISTDALERDEPRIEVIELDPLPREALQRIVLSYAPASDLADVDRVVGHWQNPYALQLMLSDDSVAATNIRDDKLIISEEEIQELPEDVLSWYERRWDSLPDTIKRALKAAIASLPPDAARSPAAWPFISDIVVKAHSALTQADSHHLDVGLSEASASQEWLRKMTGHSIYAFSEWALAQVVSEHRNRDRLYRGDRMIAATRQALSEWVETEFAEVSAFPEAESEELSIACSWLLAVSDPEEDSRSLSIAALIQAWRLAAALQYAAAIDTLENPPRLRIFSPDDPNTLVARAFLANCYRETGDLHTATDQFEQLLVDQIDVLGPDHRNTLATRSQIASCAFALGQLASAQAMYEDILRDQIRILGNKHPDSLLTQSHIAGLLHKMGKTDQALNLHQALLVDQIEVFGWDHAATLATRHNIAAVFEAMGRLDEALTTYEAILDEWNRTGTSDPQKVIPTRFNIAVTLGRQERHQEALEVYEGLLQDHNDLLGPDHPGTLLIRMSIAVALRNLGQFNDALAIARSVLAHQERVLGPEHPDTLRTRHEIPASLEELGRNDEALECYRTVLADQERVLGPEHPDTLATRQSIAYSWGLAGRMDQALANHKAVLHDQEKVLGADHPETLKTRHNIAHCLGELGLVTEALVYEQALLADKVRVLGADHPETFKTLFNIASHHAANGQLERAVMELKDLLKRELRTMGPRHPYTLLTRRRIGEYAAHQHDRDPTAQAIRDRFT